jgi:glycosyltransferase XagB
VSVSAEVLYLIVLTQVFYLVWNVKSIIFYARPNHEKLFADAGAGELSSDESTSLPRITAILAARNEPEPVLRRSLLSLLSLDYPVEKKEILLVTDSDDVNTCMIAGRLSRELGLVHVVVPKNSDPSWSKVISEARGRGAKWADIDAEQLPYSKPRALTYALPRATGQIVTVVDAEDVQGDPLVFRKAARCLQVKGYDAVQGRLRFVNYRDSWLSLQAVGDYSFWFGWLLPKIRYRGLPVALGGTCYYVRRDVLDTVGGWDPTNVTEDLELGLRLYGCGYRVGIIDVDTYEESPRSLLRTRYDGGWANQRTRWIRGTLYTISRLGRYRREFSSRRKIAIGLLLFYYLLGMFVPFLSIIGYPSMILSFLAAILFPIRSIAGSQTLGIVGSLLVPPIGNEWIAAISLLNMILLLWTIFLTVRGIAGTIDKSLHGVKERIHYYGLAGSTLMFYWILWGLPVLRALWQISRGARFWEKTLHEGLHYTVLDRYSADVKRRYG